ncbi:extended synaptotagmin-2-A-like isoform X1 [Paramuricea clavata]|uniref:Extended synaptotagmin-2-A-like isoform X1 n=1 Tax=Paramuricea clavata TaxID=317549 RepID=A0A6S7HMI5_PARCT|nr:extended synaptotagmin-2-A-like isoform X1 [Paramuricea clavata]
MRSKRFNVEHYLNTGSSRMTYFLPHAYTRPGHQASLVELKTFYNVFYIALQVFFPDVERAEWLNKFVAQLWPYVNEMVIKILKETVEPKIQESVPGMLKSIYFTEISLGNRAPRIGGIKVYTENVKRSEVIMDIDVIYSGDADFELSVKCVTVGIEDLQLRGTLRVIMSPLVPASPLVAGLSVFFLDKPELDFNLTNLLNVLDVPGLRL